MHFQSKRKSAEVPAGSMADIAFLLLTFYMVSTDIQNEKGIAIVLPQFSHVAPQPINTRNLFTIHVNYQNEFLVNGERRSSPAGLREEIKQFISNHGKNPTLSDSPEKAVVSLKSDRLASYKTHITTLDEIQAAYYELYAAQAGVSVKRFRELDLNHPNDKLVYNKGKAGIPMNISIAD